MKIINVSGNSQVTVEEAPRPKAGLGQVVIQTVMSALCGSEMHDYRKQGYATANMGHEAVGIVAELGEGVDSLSVGQRVGVCAIAGCGHCAACAKGQYTWCPEFKFYDNMHAEYFVIPALACHVLAEDVSWDVGVLITGDGLGVPYHTSTKIDKKDISAVAIFGLGPIGLGNVVFQTHLGRQVIGIDRSPERLELARQLGAAHTIAVEADTDVPARVRELTGGQGADVCIEAAGVPVTANQCFSSTRIAGTVVFNGEQTSVELSPSDDFIRRDITAIGSWFYHYGEYPAMLELFRRGLPVKSLITHHFPMEQAAEAYQAMQGGRSGKVLLHYSAETD